MSQHLARAMDELHRKVLLLGGMIEEAIARAMTALTRRDGALARQVIDNDSAIDRMEVEVEEECLKVLALHQPMARDLRMVVAILKMNNDLERVGDLAANIAKQAAVVASRPELAIPLDYGPMAAAACSMLKQALDALVNADAVLASQVCADDDLLDAMRRQATRTVEQAIREHPDRGEELMALASVARHLERIGDMATNVAEDVIYMVTGEIVRHRTGQPPSG